MFANLPLQLSALVASLGTAILTKNFDHCSPLELAIMEGHLGTVRIDLLILLLLFTLLLFSHFLFLLSGEAAAPSGREGSSGAHGKGQEGETG